MKRNKYLKWLVGLLILVLLLLGVVASRSAEERPTPSDTSSTEQSVSSIGQSFEGSGTTENPISSGSASNQSAGSEIPGGPVEGMALAFPYAIPGTNLVITAINSYDGIFLEDGSDREVTGIAAMVLVNKGSVGVEYVNITLMQGERQLQFTATALPAGKTVVVQEANAAEYRSDSYSQCSADVAELEVFERSASMVTVEELQDGSLMVTNLTEKTIPSVRIFYKFALEMDEIYVGGITYTAKINELEPGQPQRVVPSHYAAGSSEIMMVRTYETTE